MKRQIAVLGLVVSLIGASCGGNPSTTPAPTAQPVNLTIWQVFDQPEVFSPLIERYKQLHPNVSITVVTKNYADYELEVANAIAAGSPPDIWMIRNDWLPKHIDKLQPMPDGLLKPDAKNKKTANTDLFKDRYPAVVSFDAVKNSTVYGIPLSIDSLALYYNKDLFKEAGITQPPSTWSQFVDLVPKLTKFDGPKRDKILQAGAAIGTAKNVNRSSDLLMLLMLENFTPMTNNDHTSATFNGGVPKTSEGLTYPGTNALEFYTGFADKSKAAYTWNNDLPNSIDAFADGKVAMIFSYAYLGRTLLQKNPALNYGVAPMLQVDNAPAPVDYPTYWLEVVSRNAPHAGDAWQFMKFLSDEGDSLYQSATGKPPAKKLAIIPKASDRVLNTDPGSPWSFQASTAQNWYRGTNPGKIEQIFNDAIENIVTFGQTPQVALDNAAAQVTKSFQETQN